MERSYESHNLLKTPDLGKDVVFGTFSIMDIEPTISRSGKIVPVRVHGVILVTENFRKDFNNNYCMVFAGGKWYVMPTNTLEEFRIE